MKNIELIDAFKEKLYTLIKTKEVDENRDLRELGVNSIIIMKLSAFLKRGGCKVSFGELIKAYTLQEWCELIEEKLGEETSGKRDVETIQEVSDIFDLTDVQYAYWAGRQNDQELGGIGCHAYFEFDGNGVDVERLRKAWITLQKAQPMLRAKFMEHGRQTIKTASEFIDMKVHDFSELTVSECDSRLFLIREQLSHEKLEVEAGRNLNFTYVSLAGGKSRIFLSVDLLVADVASIHYLITQLTALYHGKEIKHFDDKTFARYIQKQKNASDDIARDKTYWQEVIKNYPTEAIDLPLQLRPEQVDKVHFVRKSRKIKKEMWSELCAKAKRHGISPAMFLLTVYCMVLSRWSTRENYIMNIPLFNRDEEDEEVNGLIADFTNLLLLNVSNSGKKTFVAYYKEIYASFIEGASHANYSGVQVQRDISKITGNPENIAPVVFACNIDFPFETQETRDTFGKLSYMISQTPQVWLDFQSFSDMGDLILCWDYVEQLFDEEVIEDMYASMIETIEQLAGLEDWNVTIDVLSKKQQKERLGEVQHILPLAYPDELMYEKFLEMVKQYPNKTAIIDSVSQQEITYSELKHMAMAVAQGLIENGVLPNDYVSITLTRGYRQIIAILGVQLAGAVYVPVSDKQPSERRNKIYEQIGIKHCISEEKTIESCELEKDDIQVLKLSSLLTYKELDKPVEIPCDASAYVIMTSGSTGVPKGVEIAHRSAMNTISDLNKTYHITEKDCLMTVSAVDFDLSVYDMFGMLSAGGTIISLAEDNYKNPDIWLKLIAECKVTMWNSVPILFNMLVTMAEGREEKLAIRMAFLSGDWIPIDLPGRFYAISDADSLIVAMGGATEASIWSNYLEVPRKIPKHWVSIPYGKPLLSQVYRVVDAYGRICPNMVMGELQIGGVGVAKGYRGDEKLTDAKFFRDENNVPWYRTGDNGRIWNDGTIEFLGRRDSQVKIKGHRIELGEIENAIRKFDGVKDVVVSAIGNTNIDKKIFAFLQVDENSAAFAQEVENKRDMAVFSQEKRENRCAFVQALNHLTAEFIKGIVAEAGNLTVKEEFAEVLSLWVKELESTTREENTLWGGTFDLYKEMFQELRESIVDILQGRISPIEYFYQEGRKSRPDILAKTLPGYKENIEGIVRFIVEEGAGKEAVRILDIGSRSIELSNGIVKQCSNLAEYTILENTYFYKREYEELLLDENSVSYLNGNPADMPDNTYDFVVMVNAFHRRESLSDTILQTKRLLKADGRLIMIEPDSTLSIIKVIPALLENSFSNVNMEERSGNMIPNTEVCRQLIEKANMRLDYITDEDCISAAGGMVLIATANKWEISISNLVSYLEGQILSYMMPFAYIPVDRIPQTGNGKVDHRKLAALAKNVGIKEDTKEHSQSTASTETEKILVNVFEAVLETKIGANDNYFELGGDSLTATRIIGRLREEHIAVSIKNIFENPTIAKLAAYIDRSGGRAVVENGQSNLIVDKDNRYEPFPLTEVQFAYWIGRKGAFDMGNVSTQCYFEFDCIGLNVSKLQKCWNAMIKYHEMLRSVVLATGEQQIMKKAPLYLIQLEDISTFDASVREEYLAEKRDNLSRQVLNPEKWPLFDLKLTVLDGELTRLHICFDNLILDGWSMFHLLDEMAERYRNADFIEDKLEISFRDQVMTLEKERASAKYLEDKKYWQDRMESFSKAPLLPLESDADREHYHFNRRSMKLSADEWKKIGELSAQNGITPTVFLMTAFSDALRGFSYNQHFALNLTQFERNYSHPQIGKLVGDFTNLTLVEICCEEESSFVDRAHKVQKQLVSDLEHSLYTAVEFERDLRKRDNQAKDAIMPIVFTSSLGMSKWSEERWLGKLVYNSSQTPQVWIDHQIVEQEDGLSLNWDTVDGVLAKGLPDGMFAYYEEIIRGFLNNPETMKYSGTGKKVAAANKYINDCYNGDRCKVNESVQETKHISILSADIADNDKMEASGTYEELESIWENILSAKVLPGKSFFEQGGDSLGMVKMVNAIQKTFGINISIVDIAKHDELGKLAAFVGECGLEGTI